MKKITVIALAAFAAITACTKTELTPTADKQITFQVVNYANQTKAAGDTTAFPTDTTFGAYGWYDSENLGSRQQKYMVNEKVSFASDTWKPSRTYYWPKQGDVDFISYFPYSAESPWIEFNGNGTDSATVFKGTITNCAGTEDFMYSDKALNYRANEKTFDKDGVPTLFHHALAKITVKAKADSLENDDTIWKITVSSIKIENIYKSGTVSFNLKPYTTAGTEKEIVGWEGPDNRCWTTSGEADSISALTGEAVILTNNFQTTLDQYTVVPQSVAHLAEKQRFAIRYTIETYHKGEATPYSVEQNVGYIPLNISPNWEINTSITYNITINPSTNEVYFDPAVKKLDEVSGTHTL